MTSDDLARLHARCFTSPRPWTAAEFAALLDDPHNCLVCRDDAFAMGRVIADEAEVLTIAVAPDQRRTGIGRALIGVLETKLKSRGAVTCFLEVAADNGPALALYRSLGYREAGRRKGYYRKPDAPAVDALSFSRDL